MDGLGNVAPAESAPVFANYVPYDPLLKFGGAG